MAYGQVFVSWVKTNIPQLYDKNKSYNSTIAIQQLLTKVRDYYYTKSEEANTAYKDGEAAAQDKTAKINAFTLFYNEHIDDNDLLSTIDGYVTNGSITNVLGSLQFLNSILFNFNL